MKKWREVLADVLGGLFSKDQLSRAGASPDAVNAALTTRIDFPIGDGVAAEEARQRIKIVAFMRQNLGDKYLLGIEVKPGEDSDTWDCSEIVQGAYARARMAIPDGSPYQYDACQPVPSPKPGDLGFLYNEKWGRIGHVMVATESDTVIHAVGGRGVVEDPISKWISNPRWRGWRRHVDFARPPEDRV